ncbi:hypothetical protein G7Y79_00075g099040 [Physcia stellaris]|nr:hypothetical protein G7Y79_00075g099040 [Physcia stellaris]
MTDSTWTFRYFHYAPSLAAAVIFILLFSVPTGMHGYQMLRQRAWLMIPFFLGGCLTAGERYSLVRRTWLTKIFVGGDVLSFLVQSSGGGIMAGRTQKLLDLGQNIVIGGLIVQILSFGFFLIAAVIFHIRINRHPTNQSREVPWRRHIKTLYAASILILARSIFRVVEYLQGFSGYLLSHEVFLYIFDAILMLAVMILLNVVHPSEITKLLV